MTNLGERGAATVLALVVAAALTVLGIVLLGLADVDARIAAGERHATQASFAAEAAVRAVQGWFDRPREVAPFPVPGSADVLRRLRQIDLDGPGPAAPAPAAAGEGYKEGVDRDADGEDDLFDRPHGGGLHDAFLGTVRGPDLRIEGAFLDALSDALFGSVPRGEPAPRIEAIDLFAPPRTASGGAWVARGIATVRVVAIVARGDEVLARRALEAVLAEVPYRGVRGPLHSCAGMVYRTPGALRLPLYWGPVTTSGDVELSSLDALPESLPREPTARQDADPVWGASFAAPFSAYRERAMDDAAELGDPWFRLLAGGAIASAPPADQPFPSAWAAWDGTSAPPPAYADRSAVLQHQDVGCPDYPYETWKTVAAAASNARLFTWVEQDRFREDGRGEPGTLQQLTDGGRGIYFFDTRDGTAPRADGSNLTPPVRLAGAWSFEGVLYVNAESVRADVVGRDAELVAPGEPFQDADLDGNHDPARPMDLPPAPAEDWIDLESPVALPTTFRAADSRGVREARGAPPLAASVALRGLLVTSGAFDATGRGIHHGSVVAQRGVIQSELPTDVPAIYWDPALRAWPEPASGLPRIAVVGWLFDP